MTPNSLHLGFLLDGVRKPFIFFSHFANDSHFLLANDVMTYVSSRFGFLHTRLHSS